MRNQIPNPLFLNSSLQSLSHSTADLPLLRDHPPCTAAAAAILSLCCRCHPEPLLPPPPPSSASTTAAVRSPYFHRHREPYCRRQPTIVSPCYRRRQPSLVTGKLTKLLFSSSFRLFFFFFFFLWICSEGWVRVLDLGVLWLLSQNMIFGGSDYT